MNNSNEGTIVISDRTAEANELHLRSPERYEPQRTPVIRREHSKPQFRGQARPAAPAQELPRDEPARIPALQRGTLDSQRLFFVQLGEDEGGIRMNWRKWRYVRSAAGAITAVDVIYEEHKDDQGQVLSVDKVTLVGKDAYNFLRVVGDRNADAFPQAKPKSEPAPYYAGVTGAAMTA